MNIKRIIGYPGLAGISVFFFLCTLMTSCVGGDDDGRRLGELIVGTWQRGWGQGDVIIEGNTELRPENFTYDKFIFNDDGDYNGMLRKGTFTTLDTNKEVIFVGTYMCDNSNLKLEFMTQDGGSGKIHAQVLSFTDDTLILKYVSDDIGITVTLTIRKES